MTTRIGIQKNDTTEIIDEDDQTISFQYKEQVLVTNFEDTDSIILKIEVLNYQLTNSFLNSVEKFSINIINLSNDTVLKQERTNKDLEWLVSSIKTKYPGIGIPIYSINSSQLNLNKEKCIVVQLFLNRLAQHPKLKHSPEIKAFFLEKIQYLKRRSKLEKQDGPFKGSKQWNISSFLSKLSLKTEETAKNVEQDSPIRNFLQRQRLITSTIQYLKIYVFSLRQYAKLENLVYQKQQSVFVQSCDMGQIQRYQIRIKDLYSKVEQSSKNRGSQMYLKVQLPVNVVLHNLIEYNEIFNTMSRLQKSINSNAFSNNYEYLHESQKYFQTLVNNMKQDIDQWLKYNDNLVLSGQP